MKSSPTRALVGIPLVVVAVAVAVVISATRISFDGPLLLEDDDDTF